MLAKIVILIWIVIFCILCGSITSFLKELPAQVDIILGTIMSGISGFSFACYALKHLNTPSIIFWGICFSLIICLLINNELHFTGSAAGINGLLITICLLSWGSRGVGERE